jgi:NAD(P)-dependent dehydrogenase (short-subunit alcohol dehydrogenase family)
VSSYRCGPLEGKTVIVTGGSAGVGRGIALEMAKAGAHVAVAARGAESLERTCSEIRALGRQTFGIQADVTKSDDVGQLAQRTLEYFGQIDVLVNNAGGSFGSTFRRGPLISLTERDFDECFALNTKSIFLCSRAVVPHMQARRHGAIVNIASIAGRDLLPPRSGNALYGASKAAAISLTRSMSVEFAPYIRVNCVAPGTIDSPRMAAVRSEKEATHQYFSVALGRIGSAEDVARAAIFLASEAASWITGTCIDVHGGLRSFSLG